MPRIIVVERDAALRNAIRPHLAALGESLEVLATVEEAQLRGAQAADLLIARNPGGALEAVRFACAFELRMGPEGVRLVLVSPAGPGPAPLGDFLQEIDAIIARVMLPTAATVRALAGEGPVAADFPQDAFEPLERLGALDCAEVLRVRNRVTGQKEMLVQVEDAHDGAQWVVRALYEEHRRHVPTSPAARVPHLRHEITGLHSFLASRLIPLDFASKVEGAARRIRTQIAAAGARSRLSFALPGSPA